MRRPMQKSLYEMADAGDTLSDMRCRRHSFRQEMQDSVYKTADAGLSLLDSRCRSLC